MRDLANTGTDGHWQGTGNIAPGMPYHFFEGRKQNKNGHWQGTGYFYWQRVYRDPATGKRVKRGGKAFASCPDEERKRQYLRDTGRVIEPVTGRLSKVQRSTAPYLAGLPVFMRFETDGIIFVAAPPGHKLDTGNGHILLDGKPVTGWQSTDGHLQDTDKALMATGTAAK